MNKDIKVSIVIPLYNMEKRISYCIESVLNQSYDNWELVIVDDGSKDASVNCCSPYLKDKRIKLIKQSNAGVSTARNTALEHCTGDWLLFLDSDDTITSHFVENMVNGIIDDSSMVVSGVRFEDEEGFFKPYISFSDKKYNVTKDDISDVLLFGGIACKLLNRIIVENYKLRFDTSMNNCEDCLFMWSYIALIQTIHTISDVEYNYYKPVVSTSLSSKVLESDAYYRIFVKLSEKLEVIVNRNPNIAQNVKNWLNDMLYSSVKSLYIYNVPKSVRLQTIETIRQKYDIKEYNPHRFIDTIVKYLVIFPIIRISDFVLDTIYRVK